MHATKSPWLFSRSQIALPRAALLALLAAPAAIAQATNLVWAQSDQLGVLWDEAVQNAGTYNEGGFTDWRLPSVEELVAASQDGSFGTMDPSVLYRYWTSERRGQRAYTVDLASDAYGNVVPSLSGAVSLYWRATSRFHARYVRESQAAVPGIRVDPIDDLTTTEAGGTDMFTVVLDTEPTAPVSLVVATSDSTEGLVSSATQGPATSVTLTFDPNEWDQPQIVTVTGQDDAFNDGNIAYTLVTDPAISLDLDYTGLNAADVSATNQDDDLPVVSVTDIAPGGMTTGTTISVTISGSGFAAGAMVSFEKGSGPTPTASNVVVASSTSITCSITATNGGPPGTRVWDVRVTNADSSSSVLVNAFTVTKP